MPLLYGAVPPAGPEPDRHSTSCPATLVTAWVLVPWMAIACLPGKQAWKPTLLCSVLGALPRRLGASHTLENLSI